MAGEFYTGGEYLSRHPTWHTEDSTWKAGQVSELLDRHGVRPESVCEVGCGAGAVLEALQRSLPETCRLVGYDVSPQALSMAEERANAKLTFRLGDPREESDTFDVMLFLDVIEHVEDYLGFLRDLRGKAALHVLHIPLDLSVQTVLRSGPILGNRRVAGHLHYFTKETALATLEDAGYRVIDWNYTAGSVDLPSSTTKIALAKLPRRALHAVSPDLAARILGGFSLLVLAR